MRDRTLLPQKPCVVSGGHAQREIHRERSVSSVAYFFVTTYRSDETTLAKAG